MVNLDYLILGIVMLAIVGYIIRFLKKDRMIFITFSVVSLYILLIFQTIVKIPVKPGYYVSVILLLIVAAYQYYKDSSFMGFFKKISGHVIAASKKMQPKYLMKNYAFAFVFLLIIIIVFYLFLGLFALQLKNAPELIDELLTLAASASNSVTGGSQVTPDDFNRIHNNLLTLVLSAFSVIFGFVNALLLLFLAARSYIWPKLMGKTGTMKKTLRYIANFYLALLIFLIKAILVTFIFTKILTITGISLLIALMLVAFIIYSYYLFIEINRNRKYFVLIDTARLFRSKILVSFFSIIIIFFFFNIIMVVLSRFYGLLDLNSGVPSVSSALIIFVTLFFSLESLFIYARELFYSVSK